MLQLPYIPVTVAPTVATVARPELVCGVMMHTRHVLFERERQRKAGPPRPRTTPAPPRAAEAKGQEIICVKTALAKVTHTGEMKLAAMKRTRTTS